jgi:Arc/MetJ-type ribon-helix-helix transcriptional regulator
MPKKAKVETHKVSTTLSKGVIDLIDQVIEEDEIFKSRSDFLEKGAFLLIDRLISERAKK